MRQNTILSTMMAVLTVLPSFSQSPKLKPLKEQDLLETIMPMEKKGEWGYANDKGKFIIKHVFSEARPFNKGVAIVRCGEKYGLLDKTGVFILEPTYDEMKDFRGTYSIVRLNGKYGTIGRDGKPIAEPRFDRYDSRKGLKAILVTQNGKIGALNEKGKLIVEPTFSYVGEMEDGIAFVKKDGLTGAVNTTMRTVIEPQYDSLLYTGVGVLYAEKGGKRGIISYQGEEKTPLKYDNVQLSKSKRYYVTAKGGRYGIITNTYKEILPPILREIPELQSSNSLIKQDSILFLASEKGVSWWLPERDFDLSNIDALSMPDSLCFSKTSLGTDMVIIHIGNVPYFIARGEKVVWAANPAIRKWAELPLNYQMLYEKVSRKGYMTAVNADRKTVQMEHSFDIEWPVSAIDPRVDVTLCQQALLQSMAKKIYGESFREPFSSIDEFLTYATTHPRNAERLTNIRSITSKTKARNVSTAGYSLFCVGLFVGDDTKNEITYDFRVDIQQDGSTHHKNTPQYIHIDRSTGHTFTLRDRYSLVAQSKIVKLIKAGNVILDSPEEKDAFEAVKEDCAEVDDNFYVKDEHTYFYKQPFSTCPPMCIGVRQLGDVPLRPDDKRRQTTSEYVFTSFDLDCFELQDHVDSLFTTGEDSENHVYHFTPAGILVNVDGYNPFEPATDAAIIHLERNSQGKLSVSKPQMSYVYLEFDSHGNWVKRKPKDTDGVVETRRMTYYECK